MLWAVLFDRRPTLRVLVSNFLGSAVDAFLLKLVIEEVRAPRQGEGPPRVAVAMQSLQGVAEQASRSLGKPAGGTSLP